MSYQALYRQWRPIEFDEIIGQDHITIPLKNQIMSNSYGHAYIFSGTRGTGKTSTAKIFARAVNCLNNTDGNPCNQCENCLSILEDQFIDVVEMDAASNNSVDDIRELREHIKFTPSKGRYKVYIIDEVHMLSQGAFNALLKTLEEPPEYVLFILATTELHKIPATILSRCQRYDFKRVSFNEILVRLEHICKKMNVQYDVEALKLIIQKSDGAVRDTLSGLDQCLSIGGNSLKISDVVEIFGIVEKNQILNIIQFLENNQAGEVLILIDNIIKQGKDIHQFINAMIEVYRDLLIMTMVKENHTSLIDASDEYIESIKDISVNLTPSHLSRSLDELIELSKSIKYAQNKRALLEAALMRLIYPETKQSYQNLIERIERLEKRLTQSGSIIAQSIQTASSITHKRDETDDTVTVSKIDLSENENQHVESPKKEAIESFIEFKEGDCSIEEVVEQWAAFIDVISRDKKGLIPTFHGSKPIKMTHNKCHIGLLPESKMFMSLLTNASNSEYLNHLISKLVKKPICLEYDIIDGSENSTHSEKSSSDEKGHSSTDKEAQIKDFFKDFNNVLEIK